MASRVVKIQRVGLDRAARMAGEAFAHEEAAPLGTGGDPGQFRRVLWMAACVAMAGLVLIASQ